MLHLTNGTAVIPQMREAGVAGPIVPWDDVLHEGPVPAGLGVAALRERRAEFLASCGWGAFDTLLRSLEARDTALDLAVGNPPGVNSPLPAGNYEALPQQPPGRVDEIVLWFEHDLYDQLHLLQILDRIPLDGAPPVTAVPDDDYLGPQPAAQFQGLFAARRDVTSAERLCARDGWNVFRSPDPRAIVHALPRLTELRHLAPALRRHLEQFPSIENGLSRSEQQALEAIAGGISRAGDVFFEAQRREDAFFMGDAGFFAHIGALVNNPRPLLQASGRSRPLWVDDELALTADGERVLANHLDRIRACGIDRWLGGVHLHGTGPVWRWDRSAGNVRLA